MARGKKYRAALAKYDAQKRYELGEACKTVKDIHYAAFDEMVELHIALKLGKGDTVRDTVVFPNQFKGEKKVLVFCKDERVQEALDAGAAYAGNTEYIDKIKGGWLDFDVAVATPDMMRDVGRLGMVLGRKGLMPNPKTGTVTPDIKGAIDELKKGRTEYRIDKGGVVHIAIGKVSMDAAKVAQNASVLIEEIKKKIVSDGKKGQVASISVNSSMGPGVWVASGEEA